MAAGQKAAESSATETMTASRMAKEGAVPSAERKSHSEQERESHSATGSRSEREVSDMT